MLIIPQELLSNICRQAKESYPHECCGLLVGSSDGEKKVIRISSLKNINKSSPHDRYEMDPEEYFKADREARAHKLSIIGIYHSHPDIPPIPSSFDLEHAWPEFSYLIVSLNKHKQMVARSWVLNPEQTAFVDEHLHKI